MILVKPSFEVLQIAGENSLISSERPLQIIEAAGRTCYKSEDLINDGSAEEFVRKIIKRKHVSVIEHSSITVRFIIDRGVSHELVRHRLCAFSQESTRYCDYADGHVMFVVPPWVNQDTDATYITCEIPTSAKDIELQPAAVWKNSLLHAERVYKALRNCGWSPQQARSVLPNSLKTEIVVTANIREWRHIFSLRCAKAAHPQMREVMIPLRDYLRGIIPVVFDEEVVDYPCRCPQCNKTGE